MSKILTPLELTPGLQIVCEPSFSPKDLDRGKTPNPKVKANILFVNERNVKVEIIDERPNGKRDFTNTDTYGCTCVILKESIEGYSPARKKAA